MTRKTETFRLTSLNYITNAKVVLRGVPLLKNSYRVASGKYTISIRTCINELPVIPQVGQHWKVTGTMAPHKIEVGDYWVTIHHYNSQNIYECLLPTSGEAFIRFIADTIDFKGIGDVTARKLWNEFGGNIFKLLENDDEKSRDELREHLSDDKVSCLYAGYAKYSNLAACNWMMKHQIPMPIQQRILKYHNKSSITAIKDNPYILMSFGLNFDITDKLAKALSVRPLLEDDDRRLSTALECAVVTHISAGHTYSKKESIYRHLTKLLKRKELADKAFQVGYSNAQYFVDEKKQTYHATSVLIMERVISRRLISLTNTNNRFDSNANEAYLKAVDELPYELTKKQSIAVLTSLNNSVSCITGGAGTGKTTVLRTTLSCQSLELH
jgi:exodeoxyribonuclease V alpha subunit